MMMFDDRVCFHAQMNVILIMLVSPYNVAQLKL